MVSRKTLYGAAVGGVMLTVVVVLWSGLSLLNRHDAGPAPTGSALEVRTDVAGPATDARVLGDTLLRQWGPRLDVPDSNRQP